MNSKMNKARNERKQTEPKSTRIFTLMNISGFGYQIVGINVESAI